MPAANAGYVAQVKYWLRDHDTDVVSEAPPVLNQWYPVFDADDVRLIWCMVIQTNGEHAAKGLEVKWTCDGTPYLFSDDVDDSAFTYVYRSLDPSSGGTNGLKVDINARNAAYYVDKRALHFKVEVRITSALGTNQTLGCWCVRETLEPT